MAKSIDNATAVIIADIQSGDANPNQMLATEAVSLSDRGLIKLDIKGDLVITNKAHRALRRFEKQNKIAVATEAVRGAINEMLVEPGAVTQHRAVWNKVGGPDKFDRDTVLQALNVLKQEGLVNNHRTSGNNFQVFWKRAADIVATPGFETN